MNQPMLSTALHPVLVGPALVGTMMFPLWRVHLGLDNASVVTSSCG